MNLKNIFNDNTNNTSKMITICFLTFGIIFTVCGLWRGLNDFDPKYFVLMASLVGLLISGFAIGGKLVQDIKSSKKQQEILDTSLNSLKKSTENLETATKNYALSQKIDTTTTSTNEISKLTSENINLLNNQNHCCPIKKLAYF